MLCLKTGCSEYRRAGCVGVVFKDSQAAWNIDSVQVVCVGVVFTGWSEYRPAGCLCGCCV